ncbi:MAG: hypothetical protein SAJ12_09285 [Jaaginema sp. PMC 1079.18]|nr:hypothetical protein [Jaaginema sp. PMC 1080.18]MEC4851193.1 hypothetical protein [Jaaginema sp. PMC 1079.18]MEC4864788.1 hypothetical protein [Jaaginema sp. PMC 1078.18]
MSNFPYGTQQIFSLGSLSLTLDWQDFGADDGDGIGYRRIEDINQQNTALNSLYGASILEGPFHPTKFLFGWQLNLPSEKLFLLKALYDEQQWRVKNQQSAVAIRLYDQRIAFMGRQPRDRAKIGAIISDPTAPTGFDFYWAQFDILLELSSDFSEFFMKPSELIFKVQIAGRELDTVSPSEDV